MAARRGYDPRYDYNGGYAAGQGLIDFSQLLRQGIGDYRQLGLDQENTQQKQQDYFLRLQQMLGAQEDRDLNRGLVADEGARRRAADAQAASDRAAGAATAASGRAGRFELLQSLGGGVPPR